MTAQHPLSCSFFLDFLKQTHIASETIIKQMHVLNSPTRHMREPDSGHCTLQQPMQLVEQCRRGGFRATPAEEGEPAAPVTTFTS